MFIGRGAVEHIIHTPKRIKIVSKIRDEVVSKIGISLVPVLSLEAEQLKTSRHPKANCAPAASLLDNN